MEKKIKRNQERDKKEYALLRVMGWRVLVIWECQLRSAVREETLNGLSYVLSVIMLDKYRIKGSGAMIMRILIWLPNQKWSIAKGIGKNNIQKFRERRHPFTESSYGNRTVLQ